MPNSESNKNGWKDNQPECNHEHNHNEKKEECCCKESMAKALELLSDATIKPYLTSSLFAFVGEKYLVGTNGLLPAVAAGSDNLNGLNGTKFAGFNSCNCDTIKLTSSAIVSPITNAAITPASLTVNKVSLCDIDAIAFDYITPAGAIPFDTALTTLLDKYIKNCCVKCDDCCCNDGIFNDIYNSFSPNLVTLTAGWLIVNNVKVLGKVGSVLVLSSTAGNVIYFTCLDSVGFMSY